MIDTSNFRFLVLVFLLVVVGVGTPFVLSRFTKKKTLWYVPSILGLISMTYLNYQIRYGNLESTESLAYFVMAMMISLAVIGNVLANLVLHIMGKSKVAKVETVEEDKPE